MTKYYGSLLEQYIIALENPDSIGWDSKSRTWSHATGKGMDSNQIGIGGDRYNKNIRAIIGTQNWDNVSITEAQEREARYKNLDYFIGVYNRNTKGLSLSSRKRILAMGLLYHGYGRHLWNESHPLNKALRNGSDDEFSKSIYDFYRHKNPERARNHNKFVEQIKKNDEKTKKKPVFSLKNIHEFDRLTKYAAPVDATHVVRIPIKQKIPLSQMPLPTSTLLVK